MTQYKVGKIVKGNITGVEKYGIFVNLDNFYSGLIHISEMSNDFVKNPNDYGEVGETIYVKILEVDENTNHLKLSIKDIDYRINNKAKKSKIKETGDGFSPLKEKLDFWIEEKLSEMEL
jgi:predicted RNA-binding protein with RPS1 domain